MTARAAVEWLTPARVEDRVALIGNNGTDSAGPACRNDHSHYEQFRERLMAGEHVRPCVFDTDCVAVSPFTTCAGCESDAVPASDAKAVMEQLIQEDEKDRPICYPVIDFRCAEGPPAVCLSGYCALDLRTRPGDRHFAEPVPLLESRAVRPSTASEAPPS